MLFVCSLLACISIFALAAIEDASGTCRVYLKSGAHSSFQQQAGFGKGIDEVIFGDADVGATAIETSEHVQKSPEHVLVTFKVSKPPACEHPTLSMLVAYENEILAKMGERITGFELDRIEFATFISTSIDSAKDLGCKELVPKPTTTVACADPTKSCTVMVFPQTKVNAKAGAELAAAMCCCCIAVASACTGGWWFVNKKLNGKGRPPFKPFREDASPFGYANPQPQQWTVGNAQQNKPAQAQQGMMQQGQSPFAAPAQPKAAAQQQAPPAQQQQWQQWKYQQQRQAQATE